MRLSKAITMATIILETITNRSVYKDVASSVLEHTTNLTSTNGIKVQIVRASTLLSVYFSLWEHGTE